MSEQPFFARLEPTKVWLETVDTMYGDTESDIQTADADAALQKRLKLLERRRLRRMQSQNMLQRAFDSAIGHYKEFEAA